MNTGRTWPVAAIAALMVMLLSALAACGGSGKGDPAFGLIDYPDNPGEVGAQPGKFAPNFRLELAGGGEITLKEELGKPILLNFFASWCTNCREEMEALDAVAGDQVKVIGVDFQEGEDTVLALADETGASFPMALDRKGKVSREYRATSLPVTLLLGADGRVLEYIRGPVHGEELDALVTSIAETGSSG